MTYDFAYHQKQLARIFSVAEKIMEGSSASKAGKTVPEADELVIGTGRRIDATVMFLDISGSSKRLSNSLEEQEDNLRVINLYFTEMIRVIEDHGGTVEKNTGDGLMAYFTASDGDTAQNQAVDAALSIFKAKELWLDDIVQRVWKLQPLEFRICLDHGGITVAKVGAARRFNGIVAIGATANVAAKMLSFAKEGELLLGRHVLDGLHDFRLKDYVTLHTENSGWTYGPDRQPYKLYEYTGRWRTPSAI